MDKPSPRLSHTRPHLAVMLLMLGDVTAILAALLLSLALRFDSIPFSQVYGQYIGNHLLSLTISLGLYIAIFVALRLYRCAWRFASLEMLWGVIYASTAGLAAMASLRYLIDGTALPRSVVVIFWLLSMLFVGGVRVILRLASLSQSYGGRAMSVLRRDLRPRRVVILGAGSHGARVLNALHDEMREPYEVIGFLDNDPDKRGIYIRGVRILGPLDHLYQLLEDDAVEEVLIALPGAAGEDIREYVMACRKRRVSVKIIPSLHDVINGRARPQVGEISVEDLLRRPPVRIDIAKAGDCISGKRVLVTGAGGSIGSELCRQIMPLRPDELILLGHGENSIHKIHQEIIHSFPVMANRIHIAIASVADESRMDQVFGQRRPQVVFHAAAHKHVPIMENNVLEAVQNNVMGTTYVAAACGRCGAERMVLVSTDKAVNPTSVMGATKWLCEQLICARAGMEPETSYVTVRFGNVLGSRGSVALLFHEQINRGGPVTVTHPEMTRYFMSIPEAVQLVLQAAAIGTSGELFLLEMGKPIRIMDLAHDMIRLCGYEPEVEIPVVCTGRRPGEKLHESLVMDHELLEPAECEGLVKVHRAESLSSSDCILLLRRFQRALDHGDEEETQAILSEVVPGFGSRLAQPESLPASEAFDSAAHA